MKQEDLETIFHSLSRVIIIVPLILIVVALFVKFANWQKTSKSSQKIRQVIPTSTPVKKEPVASGQATLNFDGPYVCDYSFSTGSISAKIKNKKAVARISNKNKVENILLNGDCVYIWEPETYSGQKICGISSYLSIFQALANFQMVDIGMVFQFLPQLGLKNSFDLKEKDLKNFMSSCRSQDVVESAFIIPQNILFKNIK